MKRYIVLLLHLVYWVLYGSLCVFLLYLGRGEPQTMLDEDGLLYTAVVLVIAALAFYAFYYGWFWRYLAQRKLKAFIVAGLITCACIALFVMGILVAVFYYYADFLPEANLIVPFLIAFLLYSIIHGIAATAIRGFVHWFLELRIKEALQKKNLETELALLKGQLQPHFLFNTINNIDVLIGREPARASSYLQQLSGMLRYMLYKGHLDTIPLEEEIQFIQQYITLQKIRKASPDWVRLEVRGDTGELTIAPLLFLPFLENAFKYGTTGEGAAPVAIQLLASNRILHFHCQNSYASSVQTSGDHSGLGLSLARQRMDLLYPGRYSLEVQALQNTFIVQCRIDL